MLVNYRLAAQLVGCRVVLISTVIKNVMFPCRILYLWKHDNYQEACMNSSNELNKRRDIGRLYINLHNLLHIFT
jgi:hypothetical protein